MNQSIYLKLTCYLIVTFFVCTNIFSRSLEYDHDIKNYNNFSTTIGVPVLQTVAHRIGRISLGLRNNGTFGVGFDAGIPDAITGEPVPSCEYPKSSNINYLFAGAFWIGAVVGRDTLVSTAADGWMGGYNEFNPESSEYGGEIIKRSILFSELNPDGDAVSEEDYRMVYRDTATAGIALDIATGRQHIPLNIEITQNTYAWSYPYADDFILFDYSIRNFGQQTLEKVYMGIYVDADVGSLEAGDAYERASDDISGFIETYPAKFLHCDYVDTVNIAWTADADGDPMGNAFDENSPRAATGTRIIRTPASQLEVSYNWWVGGSGNYDYGPRERSYVGKLKEEFRDMGFGTLGTPMGDVNKYYFMRNREFDFDQYRIATVGYDPDFPEDSLWLEPDPEVAAASALGLDTRYLLSFGPFEIDPGEKLPLSFAYIAGNNFHQDPTNINNLPNNPKAYYNNLHFDSLALNSAWAARVYDNPGVDTNNDGKVGKSRICCSDSTWVTDSTFDTTATTPDIIIDTIIQSFWAFGENDCEEYFYEGDGVPDFKGASPPPAPEFWLTPQVGSIHVRFNGLYSETTKDVFSHIIDFEGYRVYLSRDERESSYSLMCSYDLENYNMYVFNAERQPEPGYVLERAPFTLEELQGLYGADFNPNIYNQSNPISIGNETFYFEPQDYNTTLTSFDPPIKKIYPSQPYPSSLFPDSVEADELTDDGYLKYFEYETVIENLLPTVPYHINVTAFDFGSPESGLTALESSKALRAQVAYANSQSADNIAGHKQVYTYPNPYRFDGEYDTQGFERQEGNDIARDRIRSIHFANLPPKCTIKIFSLDGDLVRILEHDTDPLDPTSGHERWNLITRNTQLTVSGLYYWTVEAEDYETQIGKLVIIM